MSVSPPRISTEHVLVHEIFVYTIWQTLKSGTVVPPYHLTQIWCLWPPLRLTEIWCLWSSLTIWPKCDACGPLLPFHSNLMPVGPPLPFDRNLMPVVPLTIWTKIWCLWSPLTIWPNLMPVVPPYYLTQIWCLWSPLTIWIKFDACGSKGGPQASNLGQIVRGDHRHQIWVK